MPPVYVYVDWCGAAAQQFPEAGVTRVDDGEISNSRRRDEITNNRQTAFTWLQDMLPGRGRLFLGSKTRAFNEGQHRADPSAVPALKVHASQPPVGPVRGFPDHLV